MEKLTPEILADLSKLFDGVPRRNCLLGTIGGAIDPYGEATFLLESAHATPEQIEEVKRRVHHVPVTLLRFAEICIKNEFDFEKAEHEARTAYCTFLYFPIHLPTPRIHIINDAAV